DRAIRTATARNGVAVVCMPNDLSDSPYQAPVREHGYTRSGAGYSRPSVVPKPDDLARAAEVLNTGEKVAILVGAGAQGAVEELVAMADRLQADAAKTLRALLPLIDQKPQSRWRRHIESSMADWWKLMEKRALTPARPVNPQRVAWELSPRLPDNAIVTSDSGSCANWYARDLK